jgi:hypothetical protein
VRLPWYRRFRDECSGELKNNVQPASRFRPFPAAFFCLREQCHAAHRHHRTQHLTSRLQNIIFFAIFVPHGIKIFSRYDGSHWLYKKHSIF